MDVQSFWDERFGQSEYVYGTEPNSFLAESIHYLPPSGRVLCLCEGEGRNAVFLARLGYQVSGVDVSAEGKKKAERLAEQQGVSIEYHLADLSKFDFGQQRWDAVISISAHLPSTVQADIYPQVFNALKENGVFLLESYHPKQLAYGTGGPKDVDMLMTLEIIRNHFPDLEVLHAAELEREVTEGTFHTGNAYVTQFIGRKPK
ncbi:class I SAM-dependent methyltransferase [Bremerella cremea]|uniref:Class I SAM-dependent methyltransferase n=1 Tax=Bremerella cremea TaxID=1031537 RepID=A0A368KYE9_9BACT|nr:class I SAM-dependent methyltransferase [Bremerella cremea]RCS54292.1 class I SAM-dependent methyltransferase [Bremerella cremea]